jgi:hypothetical protein
MDSRERILATIEFEETDHIPLVCWTFGMQPVPCLHWKRAGKPVRHWYTGRLEHIHTLPSPWTVEDDFQKVNTWRSLDVDDILDVSVPWGVAEGVTYRDSTETDKEGTILAREYETPGGKLRHAVRRDPEPVEGGWPVQPDAVPLFEDFNIPRGVRHAFTGADDLPKLRHILGGPCPTRVNVYRDRLRKVRSFSDRKKVAVQAWAAFGLDGVVWLTGVETAIMTAVTEPELFEELLDIVHHNDKTRVALALDTGGVDLVVQRGWYSSTDFWSPDLFRRFLLPRIRELADVTHSAGKKFAYVMTTGVQTLADLLLEAGIDLLYFIDPVQDRVDLPVIRERFQGKMAVAGGINSAVTLEKGDTGDIEAEVERACRELGSGGGFILSPVDSLFPNTPWESVETMVEAWRKYRE